MITKNSIDLKKNKYPCAHRMSSGQCSVLTVSCSECSYKCPFYKPEGCRDWVRVEDRHGINMVPQEEYYENATIRKKVLNL